MLFKNNDKVAIVVKPKTHNGEINSNDYFTRYWDKQADNFRRFNLSDVVSITNISRTPLEVNKVDAEKKERERLKGVFCLSCKSPLTVDYRNPHNDNYCGGC